VQSALRLQRESPDVREQPPVPLLHRLDRHHLERQLALARLAAQAIQLVRVDLVGLQRLEDLARPPHDPRRNP